MVAIHANALNLMAQRGETTALQRAIDQGADVNEVDHDWFPLMMAVAVNQPSVVSLLLRNGAEVDKTDRQGLTSLALAVQEGHVGPMTMLLEHGADVDRANEAGTVPLFLAASTGNVDAVDVLVRNSASVDVRKRQTGATPLHAAVRRGSTDVVARLLEASADAGVVDDAGETPLLAAIASTAPAREALVAVLLGGAADVNQLPKNGSDTPLSACVRSGAVRLSARLLDAGADANASDALGCPPLVLCACLDGAAVAAQQELAELLLVHGADVDGADVRGTCGLHAAVYFGRPGLVRLFLAHGADPNRATVSVEEARPPPFDASPGKPMRSAVDDPSSLKLPPGFTPLRLATAATAAENSVFGDDAPPADFPSDGGEQQEKRRRRIADELLGAGATEPLDAWDLEGADSVARWFAALSGVEFNHWFGWS